MSEIILNTIEEAIEDIKNGKVIVVVDDEDRENEGDFICAAECVTPEIVNFMATHGRGLICAPLIEDRCVELGLELMVGKNTAAFETPFTVSVDLIGHGRPCLRRPLQAAMNEAHSLPILAVSGMSAG